LKTPKFFESGAEGDRAKNQTKTDEAGAPPRPFSCLAALSPVPHLRRDDRHLVLEGFSSSVFTVDPYGYITDNAAAEHVEKYS